MAAKESGAARSMLVVQRKRDGGFQTLGKKERFFEVSSLLKPQWLAATPAALECTTAAHGCCRGTPVLLLCSQRVIGWLALHKSMAF